MLQTWILVTIWARAWWSVLWLGPTRQWANDWHLKQYQHAKYRVYVHHFLLCLTPDANFYFKTWFQNQNIFGCVSPSSRKQTTNRHTMLFQLRPAQECTLLHVLRPESHRWHDGTSIYTPIDLINLLKRKTTVNWVSLTQLKISSYETKNKSMTQQTKTAVCQWFNILASFL